MNRERRARLRDAVALLDKSREVLSDVLFDEEMAFDSIPENLQNGERYSDMEDGINTISQALDDIVDISEDISGL